MKDLEANNMLDSAMSRASVNNSITKPWEDTDALNSNGSSMANNINTNQTCCCGDKADNIQMVTDCQAKKVKILRKLAPFDGSSEKLQTLLCN